MSRSSSLQRSAPRPGRSAQRQLVAVAIAVTVAVLLALPARAQSGEPGPQPCRLKGIEREVLCGQVEVAEDPDAPQGRRIAIHFAVVPALAKNKAPDPLFVLAGGPGQAATRVAGLMQGTLSRINTRRDIVYVDQRGTGRSNPLECDRPQGIASLAETVDPARAVDALAACVKAVEARADARQYATWIAVRDLDAVRATLGAPRVNLWSGSYGTRVALDYLRQFPQRVRSAVLDGAAPPAMALPASFAVDSEAALQAMLAACAADADCRTRYPALDDDLKRLLFLAERGTRIEVAHPMTGEVESLLLDRTVLSGVLRAPLYAPQLAAVLPYALAQAGLGSYEALFTLSSALAGRAGDNFAELMHFAVVCAEDMPRVDAAARAAAQRTRFGTGFIELYARACSQVPVRPVPAEFYGATAADVPVLVLSGGADPVTPPRHGEALQARLPRALHLVAPHLGHGVTHHGCAPDLVARFVRQASFDGIDGACLQSLPAPAPFRPPMAGAP